LQIALSKMSQTEDRETDWVDLSADQCTSHVTS
jgi:hypothetical protein